MSHVQQVLTVEEARTLQESLGEPLRPGLSDTDLDDVEAQFGFRFSLDHRTFLTAGVPVGDRWPDWLHGNPDHLRKRLDWPVDGLLYEVEHNGLWRPSWGVRPRVLSNALACARRALASVPQLVPVCGHRYLPGIAGTSGYPVLSVYRSDVAVCGWDLRGYLRHEFGASPLEEEPGEARAVEFWSDLVE
ncbi:hypothetical protein [Amycolatopsis sp. FDAARGOS 1241]|uniref:hypothetical protein n=1 Tax=Amycolatopsis sp. FDAARGOS 1241 TaxID=2778070 RepID=UPI00194DEDC1|nr:hypothetical protein [Amycolatopsis sp. FDAARGOS 1241]QRP46195.1 hypothetical protein I6J71_45400 [Amycolatopsis sp. FDAARGOS 1241]